MKISTRTEYGVRVLVTLARRGAEGPLSLTGIAKAEKMPHAYLEQLVGDLRRAGLLTATRGQSGGYELSRPAEEIRLSEIVRALEGPLLEMPCAGADDLESCNRPQPCSVHELFQRVHEALDGALTATTLAQAAATAGGPPYPPAVRRRAAQQHAALLAAGIAEAGTTKPGAAMGNKLTNRTASVQDQA